MWNTFDDIYSSFVLYSNEATFVGFACLDKSLSARRVWITIDERYSRFALLSNVVTLLGFACFDIFSCH